MKRRVYKRFQFLFGAILMLCVVNFSPAVGSGDNADGGEREVGNELLVNTASVSPVLVDNAKTRLNHNGVEVFYGYESGKIDPEELLRKAHELRTEKNIQSSSQLRRQRTINYRTSRFTPASKVQAGFYSVAPKERVLRANTSNDFTARRDIGYAKKVETEAYKKARVSLISTTRNYGVTETIKNAREKVEKRNEWEEKALAPNRKPNNDPLIQKDNSRIQINLDDSRKGILEYYEDVQDRFSDVEEQAEEGGGDGE